MSCFVILSYLFLFCLILHCNEYPIYVFLLCELRNCGQYIFPGSVHIFPAADCGNIKIAHRHMNVEIANVATKFLFWEYLFQIFSIGSLQCTWRRPPSPDWISWTGNSPPSSMPGVTPPDPREAARSIAPCTPDNHGVKGTVAWDGF